MCLRDKLAAGPVNQREGSHRGPRRHDPGSFGVNGGGGEGRAVGGRSAVSYGAAGAVNNSRAKGAVVANETKRGSNARPRDVYVSPLFSALNSVWHSRPPEVRRTQKMFSSQVKMFVGLRCCRSRTKRLKEPRRRSFLSPAEQMSNLSSNAKEKGADAFFVFHPDRATLHSGLSKISPLLGN